MTIIIHNVSDRRIGWIGPWEAEPLSTILTPEHVGRTVIYRDHGRAEAGTITSWRVRPLQPGRHGSGCPHLRSVAGAKSPAHH